MIAGVLGGEVVPSFCLYIQVFCTCCAGIDRLG